MCQKCIQTGTCQCNACSKGTTDNIQYRGPALPCSGIEDKDPLTVAIQKIDAILCGFGPTTTSTTTSVLTTTSTTTAAGVINCYRWEAILMQGATNAPVITVIDTNFPIGYTVNGFYFSNGQYFLSFSGLPFNFDPEKMILLVGSPQNTNTKFYAEIAGSGFSDIYLETSDILTGTLLDNVLSNTSISIKYCVTLPPTPTTTSTTTAAPTTTTTTTTTTSSSTSSSSSSTSTTTTSSTTIGGLFRVSAQCCTPPDNTERLVDYPSLGPGSSTNTFVATDGRPYTKISDVTVGGIPNVFPDLAMDASIYPNCLLWGEAYTGGCPGDTTSTSSTSTTTSSTSTTTTTSTTTEVPSGFNFIPTGSSSDATVVSRAYVGGSGDSWVLGSFTNYQSNFTMVGYGQLTRLTPGLLEASSYNFGVANDPSEIVGQCVKLQSNGKAIITGNFSTIDGHTCIGIARINTNGSIDTTFTPASTGFNNITQQLDIDPITGKIAVAGYFTSFDGDSRNRIVVLESNGQIDPTFTPGSGFNSTTRSVSYESSGTKLFVVGNFSSYNGTTTPFGIVKLTDLGAISPDFNLGLSGFDGPPFDTNKFIARIGASTSIYVAGQFSSYNGVTVGNIVKISGDGNIDSSLPDSNGFNGKVNSIEVIWTDKLLLTGEFTTYDTVPANGLAIINADGSSVFLPTTKYYTPVVTGGTLYARTLNGSLKPIYVAF